MQAVDQVGRDQRAEEHAVRGQKRPHEELLIGDAGRSARIVMMVDSASVTAHIRGEKY